MACLVPTLTLAAVVTYPSLNPTSALSPVFYEAFTSGDPSETKTSYDIGFDAQAVHGVETPRGLLSSFLTLDHCWGQAEA